MLFVKVDSFPCDDIGRRSKSLDLNCVCFLDPSLAGRAILKVCETAASSEEERGPYSICQSAAKLTRLRVKLSA